MNRRLLVVSISAISTLISVSVARAEPTGPADPVRPAPQIFAPGVISSEFSETTAAFTPDGKTVYFTRSDAYETDNTIMVSQLDGQRWSEPKVAVFSGEWRDSEPHVTRDGKRLYFVSNRPATPGGMPLITATSPGANLWCLERRGDGWGPPVHVDGPADATAMIYNPSITSDGTLYFSGVLPDGGSKNQIYRARLSQDHYHYMKPERLPFSDVRWNHMDPTVSPDGRFLVFASNRPGTIGSADLFIVFHRTDGTWTEPQSLGETVNSKGLENAPVLGPDGHTLYYSSVRTRTAGIFPKSREDASKVAARLRSTENGLRNLWFVDLSPWIATHAH